MIDIHCHILPGVDDGAKTLADSMAMAKEAVAEGIHTIIATPHHRNGMFENKKSNVIQQVNKLNTYLEKENIPLHLLSGQEVRIYGEMIEDYNNEEILPLVGDSSYVLIEFPANSIPHYADQLLFDMQMNGLHPIIVHPERNAAFIQRPERLYQLVKNGAATQITSGSLVGYFGKNIQTFTRQLIEANLTHLIASDAHNVTTRNFKMKEAFAFLADEYGDEAVYYFTENAELLVEGSYIMKNRPEKVKKIKRLFHLF